MSDKLAALFAWSSRLYWIGIALMVPMSLAAYAMPPWYAHVWAAVAIPTLVLLPIWLISGALAVWLKEKPHD